MSDKIAEHILYRFKRRSSRARSTSSVIQLNTVMEGLRLSEDEATSALEYLNKRGLVRKKGDDEAELTALGEEAATGDIDIHELPETGVEGSEEVLRKLRSGDGNLAVAVDYTERPRPPFPMLVYETVDGDRVEYPLSWLCKLGRTEGNDIVVQDQRSSRSHAEIKFENGAYVLRDLGSANGTLLNGEYCREQPLTHNDRFLIGRSAYIYVAPEILKPPGGTAPWEETTKPPTLAEKPKNPFQHEERTMIQKPLEDWRDLIEDLSDD